MQRDSHLEFLLTLCERITSFFYLLTSTNLSSIDIAFKFTYVCRYFYLIWEWEWLEEKKKGFTHNKFFAQRTRERMDIWRKSFITVPTHTLKRV